MLSLQAFASNEADGAGVTNAGPVEVMVGGGAGGVTDPVELIEHDEAVDSFRRSLWCDLLPLLLGFSCFS